MIKACVFDMDGVLIDTEPVWRRVERDVFRRVGIELTDAQLRETWGMRIEEVVDFWYRTRPWDGIRPRAVQREIVRAMVDHVRNEGVPLPGALEAVSTARDAGLKVGIASSSSHELIEAVIRRLDMAHLVDAVCTADDEKLGKPDPAVYMSAARLLGAKPGECIAVEDSPAGVRSAKAAGMVCIAVLTDAVKRDDIKEADVKIDSLLDFTPALLRGFSEDNDVSVTGRRA
ncbi:MAG TPA: hexitol phosphatase HxpB [Candidatus Acidoferrales bacterium]|nr:hexitol phosphatase HxpB [Candidatus Acidoferrales bacterium]